MSDKNIFRKQNELMVKWSGLRQLTKDEKVSCENSNKIYKQEDDYYKQWLFYKNLRQALKKEKIKNEVPYVIDVWEK